MRGVQACILGIVLLGANGVWGAEPVTANEATVGGWKNESELGIVAASGNSSTETYQLKQATAYRWGENVARLSGHYLYGSSNGAMAARNWDAQGRYERDLSERLALFGDNGWEGDTFIGFDYRASLDAGAKYYLIPGDKQLDYLAAEAGYRYLSEHRVAGAPIAVLNSQIARAYLEGVKAITETVSGKAWVEALPDLAHSNNFQMNFEASLSVMLSRMLSLKVAYDGKFRNTPVLPGNRQYDSLLITALVAKL